MLIFQMLVSFYLLFYGIYSSVSVKDENFKIKKIIGNKNGYCVNSNADDRTLDAEFKKTGKEENVQRVYNFLDENNEFKFLNSIIHNFMVYRGDLLDNLPDDMYVSRDLRLENKKISAVFINKHFKDIFEIECCDGDFLNQKDFEYDNRVVPVVLGNKFRGNFVVGETLKSIDNGDPVFPCEGRNIEFVVKGFLKKDSFFLKFNDGNNLVNLDKMMVFPINSRMDRHPDFDKSVSSSVYKGCISGFDIISDDIKSSLYKINTFSAQNKLFSYPQFYSWNEYYGEIVRISDERALVSYFLFFSISGFAIVNLVLSLFMMIDKENYKIGINILCGCTIKHIILRFVLQIFGAIFISLILSIVFTKNSDFFINALMLMVSLVVALTISFPIYKRLKNISVGSLIKRRE
jgi:hypothetical protein